MKKADVLKLLFENPQELDLNSNNRWKSYWVFLSFLPIAK